MMSFAFAPDLGLSAPAPGVGVRGRTGGVAVVPDPAFAGLMQRMQIEFDRLTVLEDLRRMLDEASWVDGVCDHFCRWATATRPKLTFVGPYARRAERLTHDLVDRIGYFRGTTRADYLYNGLFLEAFLKPEILFSGEFLGLWGQPERLLPEVLAGMPIGQIDGVLGPLPPETVFRNSDRQDRFPQPGRAFYQIPEPYNRSDPEANPQASRLREWFHEIEILHPRWNHRRKKSQRYSRSALFSARKAFNRAELSSTDMVVQRHLTASRLLVIYLKRHAETADIGASTEEIEEFAKDFLRRYPQGFNKPGTVYVSSGADEVSSVADMNFSLSKPADIYMHLELFFLSALMPPQLAGYSGGEGSRAAGPLLDKLQQFLEVNVGFVNAWEMEEIFLPIAYLNLFLHGIFGVGIEYTTPPATFESRSVQVKREFSEVEFGLRSRRAFYEKNIQAETGTPWDEHWADILAEKKQLAEIDGASRQMKRPTREPEGIDTGVSGSNQDPAVTPIEGEA